MKKIIILGLFVLANLISCTSEPSENIAGYETDYFIQDAVNGKTTDQTLSDLNEKADGISETDIQVQTDDVIQQEVKKDVTQETTSEDIMQEVVTPLLDDKKVEKICGDYCKKIEQCCSEDGKPSVCNNFSIGSCVIDCATQIKQNYDKAAYYICGSVKGCNSGYECSDTYQVPEICNTMCEKLDSCPNVNLIFMQTSSKYECKLTCTGIYDGTKMPNGSSYAKSIFNCEIKALDNNCNAEQVLACYGDVMCNDVCKQVEKCGKLEELFGDKQKCTQFCSQQNTGSTIAESMCMNMVKCDTIAKCTNPPEEPIPETDKICSTLISDCPDNSIFSSIPKDQSLCRWYLTGLGMSSDQIDWSRTNACESGLVACDFDQFFGCLAGYIPTCNDLCKNLTQQCPNNTQNCETEYCQDHTNLQLLAQKMCFSFETCLKVGECQDIPDQPTDSVSKLCSTIKTKCANVNFDNDNGWVLNSGYCEWIFTGIQIGGGDVVFNPIISCFDTMAQCSKSAVKQCLQFN